MALATPTNVNGLVDSLDATEAVRDELVARVDDLEARPERLERRLSGD